MKSQIKNSAKTRSPQQKTSARARPKVPTPARKKAPSQAPSSVRGVTQDQIATRAYFLSLSGNGGSALDNWVQAERELLTEA